MHSFTAAGWLVLVTIAGFASAIALQWVFETTRDAYKRRRNERIFRHLRDMYGDAKHCDETPRDPRGRGGF